MPRVSMINLGCRVNRVETDLIASQLVEHGCVLTTPDDADVVVINTCAVTGEAQAKTRKAVRRTARLSNAPLIVACGCAANLFAQELRDVASDIHIERQKSRVAERVLRLVGAEKEYESSSTHLSVSPTPTGRMRPGIKIQDGCDNRCTYCIVWKARGPSRSLPSDEVIRAVREACDRNAHEVVLTGINLGTYRTSGGDGLGSGAKLGDLLAHILNQTCIKRIRLSSIEPLDVTEDLLEVMANSSGRVAPYLHICLQSGCDETLRRMGRPYTTNDFRRVIELARSYLHKPALETDTIAGFPGETSDEFLQTMRFCEEMAFSKMHVFRYSKRPGTPAATAPLQVSPSDSAVRAGELRNLSRAMRASFAKSLSGEVDDVLVLEPGRSVDGRLFEVSVNLSFSIGAYERVQLLCNTKGQLEGKA